MDFRQLFVYFIVYALLALGIYVILMPKDSPMRGWQHI